MDGSGDFIYEINLPTNQIWQEGNNYNYNIEVGNNYVIPTLTDIEDTANSYMLHPNKHQTYYIPIDQRINRFWAEYSQETNLDCYMVTDKKHLTAEVLWYDNSVTNGGLTLTLIDSTDTDFVKQTAKVTPAMEPNYITQKARVALKVDLPANTTHGNVVVNIKRGSTVLWSWHFWITDYDPDANTNAGLSENMKAIVPNGEVHRYANGTWSSTYAGKFMMDRNLGAFAATLVGHGNNNNGKGALFYQFGRHIPLPGSGSNLGSNIGLVANNSIVYDLKSMVQHPLNHYDGDSWSSNTSLGASKIDILWFV